MLFVLCVGSVSSVGSKGARHVVVNSGNLFFLQVLQDSRHDDTGTYWCVASNHVGSVRSNNATLEIAGMETQCKTNGLNEWFSLRCTLLDMGFFLDLF